MTVTADRRTRINDSDYSQLISWDKSIIGHGGTMLCENDSYGKAWSRTFNNGLELATNV